MEIEQKKRLKRKDGELEGPELKKAKPQIVIPLVPQKNLHIFLNHSPYTLVDSKF